MRIGNSTDHNTLRANMQLGRGNNQDNQMKLIQKEITNVQQQLQKLSENKDMSPEQKMEKRKELQQQLQDLNKQLVQRQLEMRREKQVQQPEKQKQQTEDEESNFGNMKHSTMQGIISASNAMSQVKTVSATKTNMEGNSRILKSEIKMDESRGDSTENKEIKLAKLNERIENTTESIMGRISDINRTLEESNELSEKDIDKKEGTEIADSDQVISSITNDTKEQTDINHENIEETVLKTGGSLSDYHPIDIRL